MAKKIREQAISLVSYLKNVNSEDISENQDVQRMFCWDNGSINELIVTVLTEDYIPPIILGEEELGEGLVQQYIVDGIQRTTALNQFRNMNWKTTSTFENSIIQYQAKRRDEDGHLMKDENGSILWDSLEFDIKNKTFDQLPEELKKKFDEYQIRIVIHQNCTMQEISKLVRRYNRNKSMGTNQKALTWIPTYARKIKNITTNEFFKNCVPPSDTLRKNGTYEQVVSNAVMTTFHMNQWKKQPKGNNEYLEENSSNEEFSKIDEYTNRIAAVCQDKYQDIFVVKDIPVWVAVFDVFAKSGRRDEEFGKFMNALKMYLHSKKIGVCSYDSLDKEPGTKDKKLIAQKISTYTALMKEYLHIEEKEISTEETTLNFVKENVDQNADEEDIELFDSMILDCVKIDSPVYEKCKQALIALMAYACQTDNDDSFESWIKKYTKENMVFSPSQKTNYIYFKRDFDQLVNQKSA